MTRAILWCHAYRLEDVGPLSPSVQTVRMPWKGHLFDYRPQHKQRGPATARRSPNGPYERLCVSPHRWSPAL